MGATGNREGTVTVAQLLDELTRLNAEGHGDLPVTLHVWLDTKWGEHEADFALDCVALWIPDTGKRFRGVLSGPHIALTGGDEL